MRKSIVLLTILLTFGSVVFAQSARAKGESTSLTNQQKMIPFALGMSLGVLHDIYDEDHMAVVKMIGGQIRYYGDELGPVMELRRNGNEIVRRDVVMTAIQKLRAKSSRSDKWKMLTGDYFGSIFAQLRKATANGEELNVGDLRFDIEMIGALADNAPTEIPTDFVKSLRDFAKLKDLDDIESEASIKRITTAVGNILDTITD